jgi:hypothetical protein
VAAGIEGVDAYLAQDYVAGESLDIALRRGAASIADSLRVATELARALDAGARVNIEHGVLHPRDVLLSGEEVRLTGLGIARAVERIGVPRQVRRPYTAPERTSGSDWDRRADIFALAAMIHEMLWGRRVAATGHEAAGRLTEVAGGDLPLLRAVFGRALAEDPAKRFDTAPEFAGALGEAFSVRSVQAQRGQTVRLPSRSLMPGKADDLPAPPALDLFEPESRRFTVLDAFDAAPPAPVVSVIPAIADAEMPPVLPPDVVESYRPSPDSVRAHEGSRSAISPLAFALLIGAALGFAAGFGVGTRGHSPEPGETGAADARVASNTNPESTTGSAREFTEGAVEAGVRLKPDATVANRAPSLEDRGARLQPDLQTSPPGPTGGSQVVGSLLVRSTPLGARVLVDGREYGRTPLTVGNLSRGVHHVRVTRDGYESDERQVTVTSAQRAHSMTVRLSPERLAPVASAGNRPAAPSAAPLTIESRPGGATVILDGRLVGTTPLVVPDVAAGEHALRLDRDGYRRWSSAIRIVTTERNRVTASLDR